MSVPVGGLPNLVMGPTTSDSDLLQTSAQYALMEKDALKVAQEIKAEYWAVSSLTGEWRLQAFYIPAHLSSHSYASSCA